MSNRHGFNIRPAAVAIIIAIIAVSAFASDTTRVGQDVIPFAQPIDPDRYLIRPGERLEVLFVGTQLSPLSLSVDAEGRILTGVAGEIPVAGKTLAAVRTQLSEILSEHFKADRIVLSIPGARLITIDVSGAVRNPGHYSAFTSQRVSDIIDSAGGILAEGSSRRIGFSGGPREWKADLERASRVRDNTADPWLYAGTTVFVPRRLSAQVKLTGEVLLPRWIELLPEDNLSDLIALAGGPTPDADITNPDFQQRWRAGFQAGDIIIVPRKPTSGEATDLQIVGAVQNPGRHPYRPGMTVTELINSAGGLSVNANPARTTLFRKPGVDANGHHVSGRYPMQLGGLNGSVLKAADSIFVPSNLGYVSLQGELARPGLYPYESGRTVREYIQMAGGVADKTKVVSILLFDRVSGVTREAREGQHVLDGDVLTIAVEEEPE